ncbi:MAG: beta-lactamase family protein [Armatimonadetes bacterium]|nr:beta-lactamase family protein [Armatimonadota bacterium]
MKHDGPGVAVLIRCGSEVLFRESYGRADIELDVPLSPNHVFRIASITKMMTAAEILKLSEEGKLTLDDHADKYLPEIPVAKFVTVRELLSHTAGISDQPTFVSPDFGKNDRTTEELLKDIALRPSDFDPGTRWSYSNAGYVLLGAIIERVTGASWKDAFHEDIFLPLGMARTGCFGNEVIIPGRVRGYTTETPDRSPKNAEEFSLSVPMASGGLLSTLDDLAIWAQSLASGKLISLESFRQMIEPTKTLPGMPTRHGYGFGTILTRVRGESAIGHTGQIPGYTSCLTHFPSLDVTVVVLSNDHYFDARGAGRRFSAIALGQPYTEPELSTWSKVEVESVLGTYQVDTETTWTLSQEDGRLFCQRSNRNRVPIQSCVNSELHLAFELDFWVPVKNSEGEVVGMNHFEDGEAPPRFVSRIE